MASEAQIAANRANALKSTGPRDTSKSKYNGIRHGLTAKQSILPWESEEDLDAIVEAFEDRFKPIDIFERLQIRHLAECFWRMQRSTRIEANLFVTAANHEYQAAKAKPGELHAGNLEAVAFAKASLEMERYKRYDAHLQRAYEKALKRVQELASLRSREDRDKPRLPRPEPEPPREQVLLRPCAVKFPVPKTDQLQLVGKMLKAHTESDEPCSCTPTEPSAG